MKMFRLSTTLLVATCAIGAPLAAGCGLISSDVTNFDLTLPDKTFSVDTASWQVNQTQAMTLLSTNCSAAPALCGTAATMACASGCSGTCNSMTNTCDLTLAVAVHQTVDLLMEKPELNTINNEPLIKVVIDSVTYEVSENTLNVATPVMNVDIAPSTVTDPTDPMAKLIGTVDAVQPGVTFAPKPLAFTSDGQATLISTMGNFKTPFNLLVGASLVVNSSTPIPTGKLTAIVHIKAHAGV